ncbi:probable pseudouridine-5'-phosphatase isoform X2 [Teleopsis dalmanni]|uniref:probable pseudouridine-5'-phosphatase isoform X2 n=1 Tax=Teleopsis dalmanni TaxID=139649 RepID=UPI0018CF85BA|nr:probable pseudouridine-5'-phosphatase isoform X2 [Teleopsis dalmanni]
MVEVNSKICENVTHCIFDMDGLLLDTEKLYTQATQSILDEYGATYSWEVKMKVMGLHSLEVGRIIVDTYNLPITPEEYTNRQRAATEKNMQDAELMPGAERLLRHLSKHKIPIALATSSAENMVKIKTQNHQELFNLFHHRVCGSSDPEVKNGKPAPDIFLVAASRFPDKPQPKNCLVFEDAPNGVQAACSACMQSVMVPDEHIPPEMRKLATKVLKSLEDFKPEEFGLPPFQDE